MAAPAGGGNPGTKAIVAFVAKLVLSIALMAFVVSRIPRENLVASLSSARSDYLMLAALVFIGSNVLASFQWQRLLRAASIRIPFWKVCSYYHVGLFFNNFLPGNVGGDIARVLDAARYGPDRATAAATVVMDRLIATVALVGLSLVTTLPAVDRFHLGLVYAALVVTFVVSVAALWVVLHPTLLPRLEPALRSLGLGRLGPILSDFVARLSGFRHRRGLLISLIAVAAVVQLSRVWVHVQVANALGLRIPFTYFLLFVPLLAVIVSLPISFNGIGVREGAGVALFGLVGVDHAPAFMLQFTTYLVSLGVSLLGALAFLVRAPGRRKGARQVGRTS